mmetsp:Transcript_36919/g.62186  ORF Transcript_36919/g.62186 Transcript_36919/m.62186 type:complete len:256 (+) Transcript_36919:504-1271(+)
MHLLIPVFMLAHHLLDHVHHSPACDLRVFQNLNGLSGLECGHLQLLLLTHNALNLTRCLLRILLKLGLQLGAACLDCRNLARDGIQQRHNLLVHRRVVTPDDAAGLALGLYQMRHARVICTLLRCHATQRGLHGLLLGRQFQKVLLVFRQGLLYKSVGFFVHSFVDILIHFENGHVHEGDRLVDRPFTRIFKMGQLPSEDLHTIVDILGTLRTSLLSLHFHFLLPLRKMEHAVLYVLQAVVKLFIKLFLRGLHLL